jgi:ubiquinone/menaquinone biosynthesis C-methylase UbiE/DNA-binding transcriptional ArsR family regulator
MNGRALAIHDHLASLADTTRSRILLLLDRHELTVSELRIIMQLPQSTVSRHLKALADAGWIGSRAEGTSRLYTMGRDDLDASARRLWLLVREQVGPSAAGVQDQRRLQGALAERRTKSQEFFSSSAGQWDRVRDELFGDRFHLAALAAFAGSDWIVGDLGCGTGQVSATIAPFVARVIAVDASAAMLQGAKKRLHGIENVELRRGELEALPIDDAGLDAATLMLVLHHLPEPERALTEVARVVKPGGRAVVVDMQPHDRESYRQQMGHVWLGFGDEQVRRILSGTGFEDVRIVALPPDARSKGPGLFVATARRTLGPSSASGPPRATSKGG